MPSRFVLAAGVVGVAASGQTCQDVLNEMQGAYCFRNVTESKEIGMTYQDYTFNANSSSVDVQCALYKMGTGSCPEPCSSTLPPCSSPAASSATAAPSPAPSQSATTAPAVSPTVAPTPPPSARYVDPVVQETGVVCQDVTTAEQNPLCYENAMWAKTDGFKKNPSWYSSYPELNAESKLVDFQCVLFDMREFTGEDVKEGDGHNCTRPCTSGMKICEIVPTPTPTLPPTAPPAAALQATPPPTLASQLAAPVLVGSTSIEVRDQSLFSVGDIIRLGSQTNVIVGFGSLILRDPVTENLPVGATVTVVGTSVTTSTTTAEPASTSLPWWAMILLVVGLVLLFLVCGLCFCQGGSSKSKAKAKRGLGSIPVSPDAMPGQYTPIATERGSYKQGNYPPQREAAASAMFDQLDKNHDGIITRAEFEQAQQRQQPILPTYSNPVVTAQSMRAGQPQYVAARPLPAVALPTTQALAPGRLY